jgi:nucleotide-binding universal stress UspA family protein
MRRWTAVNHRQYPTAPNDTTGPEEMMYQRILVALENSAADESLLPHITQLAKLAHSKLLLVHVADGWVARNFQRFELAESEEMKKDRQYLDSTADKLRAEGLEVDVQLALGDPPSEILKIAPREKCDLIAMTTHGHRLIGDLLFGSTIDKVRHGSGIPLLIVRAEKLN